MVVADSADLYIALPIGFVADRDALLGQPRLLELVAGPVQTGTLSVGARVDMAFRDLWH
jgi:hypothetical protein